MGTKRRTKLLSADAVRRLNGVTSGERLEKRDRAMLEILYGSGIRVSELCTAGSTSRSSTSTARTRSFAGRAGSSGGSR